MAVQTQQQFLENAPLLCGNGNNSAGGWIDNREGGQAIDLYCLPQQQQQPAGTMMGRTALASQQRSEDVVQCLAPSGRSVPVEVSYALALQMDKQKREMDQYLSLQTERLRVALQRQMKEHLIALTRRLESKASTLLGQKDEDLALACRKAAELEDYLKRAEAEGQTWQRIARENEAMALSLRSTIEQVQDNGCHTIPGGAMTAAGVADDAVSCCDSCGAQERKEEGPAAAGRCRGCASQGSCMLFMPCMHLCACKLCDPLLDFCPVCRSAKHGSIEVFF